MTDNTLYTLLYNGTQSSEVSGEFSFPDYLPDVRRILRVTAAPHVTGKYMNGERLELEGSIGMTLLYLSEEGTVCAFPASLPFSQSLAVAGMDETTVVTAHLNADTPVCRLIGPRKCALRARPKLSVRVIAARDVTPDTAPLYSHTGTEALCTDTTRIPTASLVCVSRGDLRYAEDLAVTDGVIHSVLSCEVTPILSECRCTGGCVVFKGEFDISALCAVREDSSSAPVYRTLHRRVPFSETLEDDGITDAHRCEPDITVTSVQPTVTEEGRNLGVDFSAECAAVCAADTEVSVIRDAFLPSFDVKITTEPHTLIRPLKTVMGNFSAAAALKYDPQEGTPTVVDCRMQAFPERCEVSGGRIVTEGTLDISLILSFDDGSYLPLNGTAPLRWDTDASYLHNPAQLMAEADFRVCGMSTKPDPAAGTVACTAELSVLLTAAEKENAALPRVLSVSPDAKKVPPSREPLVLYYPQVGEAVWDIAKHYRLTPKAILRANRLEDGTKTVPAGVSMLVIPLDDAFSAFTA